MAALAAAGFTDLEETDIRVELPVRDAETFWACIQTHGSRHLLDELDEAHRAELRRRLMTDLEARDLYLATARGGSVAWLFPGLVLLGAGQGLCITPLTITVLSHADPAFFGAIGHGYGLAFERSVLQMGALLLVVAALTRLMPARTYRAK
jgi:hypothetical protein